MAVDKNLFLHDLAVVAILKNEGHYLKEWLDYHLLAGVDHFYLYDNESNDNQAEVAKPYVEAGFVDYFFIPGKAAQMFTHYDAVKKFKFFSRYIAIIDGDEFIFPKSNRSIVEVVDEILLQNSDAAGLSANLYTFGSNGHEKADYSRGVLERFTKRDSNIDKHISTISNPRKISFFTNPHHPIYFEGDYSVNENGSIVSGPINEPATAEKIVMNHYHTKSREEYAKKVQRGNADHVENRYSMKNFELHDRNEESDDGILKYRTARAENFSLESADEKFRRVKDTLTKILSRYSDGEIFNLETALTCRALSNYLHKKFPNDERWKMYEEASLAAVLKSLDCLKLSDVRLLLSELPELLFLPYPAIVKELHEACLQIIPQMMRIMRFRNCWDSFVELDYIQRLLINI